MTTMKTSFLFASVALLVLTPAFAAAQQPGGQLVVQPTLGEPQDWELNRDANVQAYVDLLRSNLPDLDAAPRGGCLESQDQPRPR